MRNLIIFTDGTSNTKKTNTNVRQFYTALEKEPSNLCFYDRGVGSFKIDFLGKAFGKGVAKNIRECYKFIVDNYQMGDRIFVFGFSRGAYTARSLASFVSLIGIVQEFNDEPRFRRGKRLPSKQETAINDCYTVYKRGKKDTFRASLKRLKEKRLLLPATVYGIGVWDTVGALGLPNRDKDEQAYPEHRYHDMKLPRGCKLAYQALAIDEERRNFEPILFKKRPGSQVQVEEVWFPGMHSDVGGGYETKILSNLSLAWMATKFSKVLDFDTSGFGDADPCGKMHDSAKKIYEPQIRKIPKNSRIHSSTISRIKGPLVDPNPTREPEGVYRPRAFKGVNYEARPNWGLAKNYSVLR